MQNNNSNNFSRGRKVDAKYLKTPVSDYNGNPLIEALPPIHDSATVAAKISHLPDFDEAIKEADAETRYHYIQARSRFFVPLNVHLDLERRFSCALRMGYLSRNPLGAGFWNRIDSAVKIINETSFDQYGPCESYVSTAHPGFNVIGISGGGKTQTIERIAKTYPQVIVHNNYNGTELTETQIVWLKLDCPFDGSLKGLCINFFQAVDALLGTNYQKNYAGGRRTTDEMLPYIAMVAANHHLGMLIIDEIQRLSLLKSGGEKKMLNFFVQLVNTIGIPVSLIGTFKALELFSGNFSQMRRGTGQGDLIWDRMSFDEEWELFVQSMWKFEITRRPTPPEKLARLSEVLYEETQGIIDLAVKTFMFSQERAIENGTEKITPAIIRSVVHDKFQILRPALKALKNKERRALEYLEDAYPFFLEDYYSNSRSCIPLDSPNAVRLPEVVGEIAQQPEIKQLLHGTVQGGINVKDADQAGSPSDISGFDTFTADTPREKDGGGKVSDDVDAVLTEAARGFNGDACIETREVLRNSGFVANADLPGQLSN